MPRHPSGGPAPGGDAGGDRPAPAARRRPVLVDFEIEDVLLAAWLAVAARLLASFGGGPAGWLEAGHEAWAVGALAFAIGVLLVTRGPDDTSLDVAIARRVLLVGPAFPLVSLYGLAGSQWRKVRHRRRRAAGLASPDGDVADTWPGPLIGRAWRRTVALPVALVGDLVFRGSTGSLLPDPSSMRDPSAVVHLLMVAAGFVFAVVGPRVAAGATMAPWPWVSRFALAVVAAWTGARLDVHW